MRRILRAPITLIVLVVLVVAFSFSVGSIYLRARRAASIRNDIAEELRSLETRRDALSAQVEYLKTKLGREDEIRTKFNVKLPGEQVLVIVDKEKPTTTATTTRAGFFTRMWRAAFR